MNADKDIEYRLAKEKYASLGVNTDKALKRLKAIPVSLPCWQGDDVTGFEKRTGPVSGGGIQATGSYPGKARNSRELRQDLEKALSLVPGSHRVNLHAIYGDFVGRKDRNEIDRGDFASWVDWAEERKLKLDFNATCFAHPMANSGFTLSSREKTVRNFWIEHVKRCRDIAAFLGEKQGSPCIHNLWIPDGSKDIPASRALYREYLKESLDEIFGKKYHGANLKDAVESKLFGLGSESFVVGSHEFYMGYALRRGLMLCLDTGHFHPTESVADKISALLQYSDELLIHVSRGVRWDSDHIALFNDELRSLMEEVARAEGKIYLALDYFDASLNRVGAWMIGARAALKALLAALLMPEEKLMEYDREGDKLSLMNLLEEMKTMPLGAVWEQHCRDCGVPSGRECVGEIKKYEKITLERN